MRKRLWKYSLHDSLVKTVFDTARYRGLSGEDMMTILAFEALRQREKLMDDMLDRAMREPMPPIVFTP